MSNLDTVMGWAALYGELYLSNSDKNKVRKAQAEITNMRETIAEARRIIKYYAKDDPEPAAAWLEENPEPQP